MPLKGTWRKVNSVKLTQLIGHQTMQDWFWKIWTLHQSGRGNDSWTKLTRKRASEGDRLKIEHTWARRGIKHKPTVGPELQRWRRREQAKEAKRDLEVVMVRGARRGTNGVRDCLGGEPAQSGGGERREGGGKKAEAKSSGLYKRMQKEVEAQLEAEGEKAFTAADCRGRGTTALA